MAFADQNDVFYPYRSQTYYRDYLLCRKLKHIVVCLMDFAALLFDISFVKIKQEIAKISRLDSEDIKT